MNSVILNGVVSSHPKTSETKDGALKTTFTISTDGRDLPLHFTVLSFGNPASTASKLIEGDEILVSGRLVASSITKTMSIVANSIEILFENGEENDNESTKS